MMRCPHNFHCVGGSDKGLELRPLDIEPTKPKGNCFKHRTIKAIAICNGKPVCLRCWERMAKETQGECNDK